MASEISQQTDREQRLDEAIAQYLECVDAGRRPAQAEWLARFPDLASELERFFRGQEHVQDLLVSLTPPTPAQDGTVTSADRPAPAMPAAGTVLPCFGDYQLLPELARGGMGVVYKAQQRSLHRTVALTMILAAP